MSLRVEQLEPVAAEVNRQLAGGVVQKVHAPTTTRVYLEVRVPGRSALLLLCSEVGAARLSAVEHRPSNPPVPPTWQSVLRRELTGARLADAEALPARRTLLLHLTKGERFLTLVLEVTRAPVIALLVGDKVLTHALPGRPGLRPGQPWTPEPTGELPAPGPSLPDDDSPGVPRFLPLLHSLEVRLAPVEQKRWDDARRAPLVAKLKKLRGTITKVRAEASRGPLAEALRREGELLAQNLHRLRRGAPSVSLTEYGADGEVREVTVTLDPRRGPKEEVERRFHQYRRLLRGVELATKRLAQLEAEATALEQASAALDATPAAAPVHRAKSAGPVASLPYREYLGHGGQRLWVGRGAAHNDELTFHVARPYHLWLHARGVPGAHVVVPLDKQGALLPEVLLDAAHLAAHHSDARGEPRVEVSYVAVKHVRKPRDAGPGAVVYTREKTLLLRLEPERLARLLATTNPV